LKEKYFDLSYFSKYYIFVTLIRKIKIYQLSFLLNIFIRVIIDFILLPDSLPIVIILAWFKDTANQLSVILGADDIDVGQIRDVHAAFIIVPLVFFNKVEKRLVVVWIELFVFFLFFPPQ
jgi:hypothetical protein